jgi:tRNA C32,U32 (ribose-2'-O)-methylase TrmJ
MGRCCGRTQDLRAAQDSEAESAPAATATSNNANAVLSGTATMAADTLEVIAKSGTVCGNLSGYAPTSSELLRHRITRPRRIAPSVSSRISTHGHAAFVFTRVAFESQTQHTGP